MESANYFLYCLVTGTGRADNCNIHSFLETNTRFGIHAPWGCSFNTLRPRQNRRHFADDIFKCIFLNENAGILIKVSLKFASKYSINNIPALGKIMAWRRPGDKPLSEPMLVRILTHICVTRPQWVNETHHPPNIQDTKSTCKAVLLG